MLIPGAVLESPRTGWLWPQRNCSSWRAICAIKRATTTSRWSPAWIGRSISRWCITSTGSAQPEGRTLVLKVRLADKAAPSAVADLRLARRRSAGARSLRHDGDPLRRPPQPAAHPAVGRLRRPPLRKDYKESYFEEDVKPFKSRHPDGNTVGRGSRAVEGQHHLSGRLGPRPVRSRRCSTGGS